MDLKKLLNEQQYEAATTIEGPLLILAGAGSGKTRVLTYRIAHMIKDLGIYPSQILAITFTNKAAGEMKDRIRNLVGDEVDNMWISTFHSSCVRILRREIDKLGYNKNFTIYDSYDQKTLIKQCMKELNINDKDITDREIINKISDSKNNLISAEEYKKKNEHDFRKNKIADVYLLYQKKLKSNNALDFDDLIYKTVMLFKKHNDVLEFYQRKFKYIMVDEYQDTNECQYQFVKLLADANKNIFVVGDDDQCLPEGTPIRTTLGTVNIEELREKDRILCASGNGEVSEGSIDKVIKKEYNGMFIKIITRSGRTIKATPNHITFARINDDLSSYKEYKHNFANTVNLNFFSGEKEEGSQHYSHKIELITSEEYEKLKAIEAGFFVKKENINTWRIETERVLYDEAERYGKRIIQTNDDLEIVRKAKLTKNDSYYFMPIGSLKQGMIITVFDNNEIVEDVVESVYTEEYKGYVYDLSVPDFRQYIANDVIVHNCIYEWRGANIRNILDFEKDFPDTKVIKLEQNYRSKGTILEAANQVIRNNVNRKGKTLRTEKDNGDKIKIYRASTDKDEAAFVASEMKRLIREEGREYKDFAVLYRMNSQSRSIEEAFRKNDIPYRIIGGLKFYDRKEIKDIMAYLKLICNPYDDISLQRIINEPKRSIGKTTLSKVIDFAAQTEESIYNVLLDAGFIPGLSARNVTSINKFTTLINEFMELKEELTVSEMIRKIIDETGYMKALEKNKDTESESRIENLKELVSEAVEFEMNSEDKSVEAFLENKTLVTDMDNYDENADAAVMMTIHSAKGLEFPVVFMVGMENGIFPSEITLSSNTEMEEARRLCYVAITRAEEKLYMTSAEQRMVFGRMAFYSPSDFIDEIPSKLKEFINNRGLNRVYNGSRNSSQFSNSSSFRNSNIWSKMNTTSIFNTNATNVSNNSTTKLSKEEVVVGRKVKHKKFGVGTIVNVSGNENDIIITVAFDNMGIKKLMIDSAPLELC